MINICVLFISERSQGGEGGTNAPCERFVPFKTAGEDNKIFQQNRVWKKTYTHRQIATQIFNFKYPFRLSLFLGFVIDKTNTRKQNLSTLRVSALSLSRLEIKYLSREVFLLLKYFRDILLSLYWFWAFPDAQKRLVEPFHTRKETQFSWSLKSVKSQVKSLETFKITLEAK